MCNIFVRIRFELIVFCSFFYLVWIRGEMFLVERFLIGLVFIREKIDIDELFVCGIGLLNRVYYGLEC